MRMLNAVVEFYEMISQIHMHMCPYGAAEADKCQLHLFFNCGFPAAQ
jgi:hypothetical protein